MSYSINFIPSINPLFSFVIFILFFHELLQWFLIQVFFLQLMSFFLQMILNMVVVGKFHEIDKVNAWFNGTLLQQNEQLFLNTLHSNAYRD
jgi:hypothetical protein